MKGEGDSLRVSKFKKGEKLMGIMTRFVKLCKADMHGVMDRLEDKELLLKQYVREMEESIGSQETELEKMAGERDRAKREYEARAEEMERTEQDLAVAIEKDKDDIARFLIKKLKPMTRHRDELARHMEALDSDITGLTDRIQERRRRFEELKLRAGEFFRKREATKLDTELRGITAMGLLPEQISEEEVDIELIRRKDALLGGV